ncbi:hypothetical protein [Legionella micdadei]|uniref:Uncharacterized protein n=1 Tax=Legionella micdadei TaxID=451 RepID=A0A098GI08_LEGMI|nr:hypothetical protein [Legionella micdadei]ARG98555.1 hypothetical protein B6N58_13315 [Legionella micdadei]KTD27415.1 hypothetical protein Lmic_2350 [Legionella micdadei]CEG62123.1 conserved exported protein of unknown function [Legionella micdadei]SCY74104.1 hypothetical protein SAMN02982997_02736 [Legionella micdadei]
MAKYLKQLAVSGLLVAYINFATAAHTNDIKQLVQFLISPELLIASKDSQAVPLSYYIGHGDDIARYFGDYICSSNNTCTVIDSLYTNPYAILGRGLPPQQGTEQEILQAQAQIERTDMKYGADIYDASTWQIALALAAKNGYLDQDKAKTLIANQLQAISHKENRATNTMFQYGYKQSINDPKIAFTFRMITTNFQNKDPFYQTKYQDYIRWDYDPEEMAEHDPQHHSPDFFKYVSTWSDWKPITGENAWAQLIGPLQAEAILNHGKVDSNSPALKNAIASLYAFSAMQAGIGAFYYAPGGSQGNQGPIPQGEISIENNFSVLGGLQILKQILQNSGQTPEVIQALASIDVMLNGGTTVNGYQTIGLLSFLYNGAYDKKRGVFYTHGTAADPASTNGWVPDTSQQSGAMAVDINTWGTSALGVETIDKWYGAGTALTIWKNVRNKGGYFNNGQLWGVGYTLNNNAGDQPEKIMSTEWTAGAINTLYSLIDYYEKRGIDTSELKTDLASMQEGITHLRNDLYLSANFNGATPKEYYVTLPETAGQAYLYASKRFAIPFGWNANTLPSTTSNAWILMNEFKFNPFQYLGKLSGENYPTPPKVAISGDIPPKNESLPKEVTVKFTAGDLGPITELSLNYNLDGSQTNWINAATVEEREGVATLPKGTKAISIAFFNEGWSGACQIRPATKLCKEDNCNETKVIGTRWSADGKGDCNLVN